MKSKTLLVFSLCIGLLVSNAAEGQGLVNKLKQKAAQVAEKAVEKKVDEKLGIDKSGNNNPPNNSGNNGSVYSEPERGSSGRPVNRTGSGLVSTPPDVNENLKDAEAAYKSGNFGQARAAVQQAMLGVEMEIGKEVLALLPKEAGGLKANEENDQVTSAGWGWVGLTIVREYGDEEKQLRATVANNSAWMSAVNMYLNSGYGQTTGGQQSWKQIKVKGHRGIIEYSDESGYKLSIPIGQSSLLVFEGINFANEQEVIVAVSPFDIDGIKKKLGEQ